MRELVYHVAVTADGFIARTDGSSAGFLESGEHAAEYVEHLKEYDTVIMGRKTYEFAYAFGLQPGQAPYPHMRNIVVSRSIELPDETAGNLEVIRADAEGRVRELKEESGSGPIYLCGGGDLAGQLRAAGLIDRILLKVNPVLFGAGIPLFGSPSERLGELELAKTKHYSNGVQLVEYRLARAS